MWCVELWSNGGLVMCPEAWLKRGFWEDYFDRKQAAIHLFNKVTAELELEDSGGDIIQIAPVAVSLKWLNRLVERR